MLSSYYIEHNREVSIAAIYLYVSSVAIQCSYIWFYSNRTLTFMYIIYLLYGLKFDGEILELSAVLLFIFFLCMQAKGDPT